MELVRTLLCLALLAAGMPAAAQEKKEEAPEPKVAVNSFYERGPVKEYSIDGIFVEGEVESPGPVAFAGLPRRQVAVKETGFEEGKPVFRGSFLFSGYSLYDILNAKPVKKARADFSPEVDLYVVVENAKGEKAVFSWGEIYYARNNFNALIYGAARSVTAPKRGRDWPLPETSRLVCADDLYNVRFIASPTKITVKSAPGGYPGAKHAAAYAPEFKVVSGGKSENFKEVAKIAGRRGYVLAAYGHGTGFKEIKNAEGYLFKDVLAAAGAKPQDSGDRLVVVSAGDGYRAAFSLSELVNRGDNADFLLLDRGADKEGRYSLLSASDFFVDRNVRSVAKVEIFKQ